MSSRALAAIRAAAAGCADEVCGLLLGTPDRVEAILPCRNVAAAPRVAFEIDPAALLAAHRAARGGGPAVVGCYHSHPTGRAEPSPRDAAAAAPDGGLWLIVADGVVAGWRAMPAGPWLGRFAPVTIVSVADGAS